MKNADKEFEKQQTVSIGRGLSILGFFRWWTRLLLKKWNSF
jgi:hypothetical protein